MKHVEERAATEEARALVPGVEVAIVKEDLSPQAGGLSVVSAILIAPKKAQEVIRQGAKRTMTMETIFTNQHLLWGIYL